MSSLVISRDFQTCVQCDSAAPKCPVCDEGYTCTMISQSCSQCATTKCIQSSSSGNSGSDGSSNGGSNAGAIAGGVIGGVACIAIVTFLIWWFFVRKKRSNQEQQVGTPGEKRSVFEDTRQSRKSTNSIASTVLTRASNVIQIAYIPGVTNRSPPETPGSLVPPVPPLPGASPDQHFFMPGDLRDSSWSDMSQPHRSIAPSLRSSVATTIYRNNAIVSPMPAQQVMRTRAAVVSIHNGGNAPSTPEAPAVPAITQAQLVKAGVSDPHTKSSIVARTVTAKPVMVKATGAKKITTAPPVQPIQEQTESSSSSTNGSPTISTTKSKFDAATSTFDTSSSDEEDSIVESHPKANSARNSQPARSSRVPTVIEDSPAVDQSPFRDQNTDTPEEKPRLSAFLDANGGTWSNRSSRTVPPRGESPFSDANEVK
ncbi:uncharacterized protein ACLA_041860 [Aspergillus clavatus NRRL 1]|uniref:Membrane anchor Opy2 N-terminal domain-containing protein n=1 Tax=Aspergillus clavatus (strain ATCC 1007 / CBS 513.65 / DSM 816 / NCTC 3887 / NRRL 1 / QM 1276 / 107) TaxID=344612 RepID=A1CLE0_ASPCL|nr:uncharacterized protein ACLA_041860 [Aspergillus clavatus NRRL 1]EAW09964.1 conserved hypothetical protein [Aspergillus clavatus NRRL 1]